MAQLKDIRIQRGYTQRDLAELADTTPTVICYLEAGERYPSQKIRERIESVLGCPVDWIATRLQGAIRQGYEEGETAEDQVTRAIFIFIQSAQRQEKGYRFEFLRELTNEFEKKYMK